MTIQTQAIPKPYLADLLTDQIVKHTKDGNDHVICVLRYIAKQVNVTLDESHIVESIPGQWPADLYYWAAKRARNQRSRARRYGLTEHFMATEWLTLVDACNYRCAKCGGSWHDYGMLTVDHIQPLSQGGSNMIDNLQPLCEHPCHKEKEQIARESGTYTDYRRGVSR